MDPRIPPSRPQTSAISEPDTENPQPESKTKRFKRWVAKHTPGTKAFKEHHKKKIASRKLSNFNISTESKVSPRIPPSPYKESHRYPDHKTPDDKNIYGHLSSPAERIFPDLEGNDTNPPSTDSLREFLIKHIDNPDAETVITKLDHDLSILVFQGDIDPEISRKARVLILEHVANHKVKKLIKEHSENSSVEARLEDINALKKKFRGSELESFLSEKLESLSPIIDTHPAIPQRQPNQSTNTRPDIAPKPRLSAKHNEIPTPPQSPAPVPTPRRQRLSESNETLRAPVQTPPTPQQRRSLQKGDISATTTVSSDEFLSSVRQTLESYGEDQNKVKGYFEKLKEPGIDKETKTKALHLTWGKLAEQKVKAVLSDTSIPDKNSEITRLEQSYTKKPTLAQAVRKVYERTISANQKIPLQTIKDISEFTLDAITKLPENLKKTVSEKDSSPELKIRWAELDKPKVQKNIARDPEKAIDPKYTKDIDLPEKTHVGNGLHANKIFGGSHILSQAPSPKTVANHFEFLGKEDIPISIDFTNENDRKTPISAGKYKSMDYIPKPKETETYYTDNSPDGIKVNTLQATPLGLGVTLYTVQINDKTHFHFKAPVEDFSPGNPAANMLITKTIQELRKSSLLPNTNGPVLAHCSAGVGRSGSWAVQDKLTNDYEQTGSKPDLTKLIKQARIDRGPKVVQRPGQLGTIERANNNLDKYIAAFSKDATPTIPNSQGKNPEPPPRIPPRRPQG